MLIALFSALPAGQRSRDHPRPRRRASRVATVQPRPAVTDLGMAPPRDSPDRRRSVVYLESGPIGAFDETSQGDAALDQRNEAFFPYVLAVQAGTSVAFPNDDRTYHNVFSFSKAKRFDLGRYPRGQSKSVRFDRPGVVRVFCDIHSHMSAFILVFAHPYLRDHRRRGPLPDSLGARGLLHDRGLDRRRRPRDAEDRGSRRGGGGGSGVPGPLMALLSSLRNRIFLAGALVAVLSVAVAIQVVTRRVTAEAEADLRRSLDRAARLVEEQHASRLVNLTAQVHLIADLPTLKAAVTTSDPPDGATGGRGPHGPRAVGLPRGHRRQGGDPVPAWGARSTRWGPRSWAGPCAARR